MLRGQQRRLCVKIALLWLRGEWIVMKERVNVDIVNGGNKRPSLQTWAGGVCLFQINSPYNDALKDNLWGIKDRHIGSAPAAHPQPLRFPRLILFYSIFFTLSNTFSSDFPSLAFDFAYLLIWRPHCRTALFCACFYIRVFICRCSSSPVPPLSLHSYISFDILPSFINSSSLSSPVSLSPLSLPPFAASPPTPLSLCHCASCVMSQGLISGGQPLSRWQPEQQLPGGWEGGWWWVGGGGRRWGLSGKKMGSRGMITVLLHFQVKMGTS